MNPRAERARLAWWRNMAYALVMSCAILGRARPARPCRVLATRPLTLREIVAKSSAHALLLTLARRGKGAAVHEGDAVVIAHREHGARFALARHPEVPDAGVVRAELVRLVRRGYVRRVKARVLRVTAEGRRAAFDWGSKAKRGAPRVSGRCPRSRGA